jgi:cysteine-rich CPXCG protein
MAAAPPRKSPPSLEPDAIDALYGLEPVFEPEQSVEQAGSIEGSRFESIQCPYCGESFEILADLSAGSASYIEDCQVCCRPIEISLSIDDAGVLRELNARRSD